MPSRPLRANLVRKTYNPGDRMKNRRWWGLLVMTVVVLPGAAWADEDAAARCAALARQDWGAQVVITAARALPAGNVTMTMGPPIAVAVPARCEVTGSIGAHQGAGGTTYAIGFALDLPEAWNGRYLLQGGGGLNGTVHPPLGTAATGDTSALARGFAVASHDSGHQGAVFDAAFMADQRAALDFAEAAVLRVTEVTRRITAAHYRRPIAHSYMAGCSTGGREAMLAAERYPELFDGIIVGAPAMRTGNARIAMTHARVAFNQVAPRDPAGLPLVDRIASDADRAVILKGMLDACDGLDGRRDGIIDNVGACTFRPAAIACAPGQSGGCIAPALAAAIDTAFSPPRDKAGHALYTRYPYDTGIVDKDGMPAGFLPNGKGDILGPPDRSLVFDPDAAIEAVRADAAQALTDTDRWTNLSTFLGHKGKILLYHGVSDPWFSAFDTLDWWQRAGTANGADFAEASRFYMVPGMGHCGGGKAYDRFDLLTALVDWVEAGKAPGRIAATGARMPGSHALCPWPAHAHFAGGDPAGLDGWACRSEP